MDDRTKEKLAKSLTAENMELIPHLPYLLQDLWELGSNPDDIICLLRRHAAFDRAWNILDLGCGKGAVAIRIAREFGIPVKGIDFFPEFIDFANTKARESGVSELCRFTTGDINEAVLQEKGYDYVIYGAVGDVLGTPGEIIPKLRQTIKPGGYIIYEDAYLPDGETAEPRFSHQYPVYSEWMDIFKQSGVTLVDETSSDTTEENDRNTRLIAQRAEELSQRYPEHKALFDHYVQSQQDESDDLTDTITGVTWLLRSNPE